MRIANLVAAAISIATVAVSIFPSSAEGQLRICNKSPDRVSISATYLKYGNLTSHGWYVANAGECLTVVGGSLRNRYYYIHAYSTTGRNWGDTYYFCTLPSAFEIAGQNECQARGYTSKGFFVVDTGNETFAEHNLILQSQPSNQSDESSNYLQGLQFTWRRSLTDTATTVLQVRSLRSYTSSLLIRCFTNLGSSKVLSATVPSYGLAEIGYLEGWDGNFIPGEYCNVLRGDETVRRVYAPNAL